MARKRKNPLAANEAKYGAMARSPKSAKGARAAKGTYKGKSQRPGGGRQFAKIEDALMKKGMSQKRAGAIAASAGRKKYGKAKMAKWSAAGRRRAMRKR